jgi:two-component sensor histidine kinase
MEAPEPQSLEEALAEIARLRQELSLIHGRTLSELHARTKNSYQVLSALVSMSVDFAKPATQLGDQPAVAQSELQHLNATLRMLYTVADLFDSRASPETLDHRSSVPAARLLERICATEAASAESVVEVHCDEDVQLGSRTASSIGFAVMELVRNAHQHGGPPVVVRLFSQNEENVIEVSDAGRGFTADFDIQTDGEGGLEIIRGMTKWDLRGRLELGRGSGAVVRLIFPTDG